MLLPVLHMPPRLLHLRSLFVSAPSTRGSPAQYTPPRVLTVAETAPYTGQQILLLDPCERWWFAGGWHDCNGWRRIPDRSGGLRDLGDQARDAICLRESRLAGQLPAGHQ